MALEFLQACGQTDRRTELALLTDGVAHVADLLPAADRFTDSGVTSFSQLLFDVSRDQVVVGAR